MKIIFIAAALALSTFTVKANKNEATKKETTRFTQALQSEFGNVENVSWSPAANEMFKASFMQQGEKVNAFFDENGAYIASTVEIPKDDLPYKIKKAIEAKEKDGVVTEAIKMENSTDPAYYIKVYVNGVQKIYKGYESGAVSQVNL